MHPRPARETATPYASIVVHQYDADGNRVGTVMSPVGGPVQTTGMLVDTVGGLSHVVAEMDGGGALVALYVRQADELLAVMRPAGGGAWETRYVHHDGIGSVRTLTDEAGSVVNARSYEAFGSRTAGTGNDVLAYGYAGEAFDGASGLAYHRARWMDPRSGRFVSEDPVTDCRGDGCRSLYGYAASGPLTHVDPSGLFEGSLASTSAVAIGVGIMATIGANVFDSNSQYIQSSFVRRKPSGYDYIDVRATPLTGGASLIGSYHLFMIIGRASGSETIYRAGPLHSFLTSQGAFNGGDGVLAPGASTLDVFGPLHAEAYTYDETAPGDWDPLAPSVEVLHGNIEEANKCLSEAYYEIQAAEVPYKPLGPNSNSFVHELLTRCNLEARKPPVLTPGWNTRIDTQVAP
jgi:RHS repeat-associated protein